MHDFNFHEGGIIIDHNCYKRNELLKNQLEEEFGEFKYAVKYYLADECQSDSPEIWQKWWTNQMVGNASDDEDDGPWNSPQMAPGTVRGCHCRDDRHHWWVVGITLDEDEFPEQGSRDLSGQGLQLQYCHLGE